MNTSAKNCSNPIIDEKNEQKLKKVLIPLLIIFAFLMIKAIGFLYQIRVDGESSFLFVNALQANEKILWDVLIWSSIVLSLMISLVFILFVLKIIKSNIKIEELTIKYQNLFKILFYIILMITLMFFITVMFFFL